MSIVIQIREEGAGKVSIQVDGEHTQESRAARICDVILPVLKDHFRKAKLKRIRAGVMEVVK